MIGVVAGSSDLAIVKEFFELFKTPWEPCRHDRRYTVVVAMSPGESVPAADLTVIYGLAQGPDSGRARGDPAAGAPLLAYGELCFPVYGGLSSLAGTGEPIMACQDTGQVVGTETSGRKGKTVRIGYDLVWEIRFLLSCGQPARYARIPTLDLHISLLRNLILACGLPLLEVPPVPAGYRWILCLTHDVDFVSIRAHRLDRTVMGFLRRATIGSLLRSLKGQLPPRRLARNLLAAFSLPLIHLRLAPDFFNQFRDYLRLEGSHRSTFFLIPFKDLDGEASENRGSRGRATRYDVGDIGAEIEELLAKGCEVGLHGLDAWHDVRKAAEEEARIRQASGSAPVGVRMHWLFMSRQTPEVLAQAGFKYDSTCGYNEEVGFRAGTAQVFRPAGTANILELPLHVQDTALFSGGRLNLPQEQGVLALEKLADLLRRFGGELTVNWHMRSLGPERFWDEPYRLLLRLAEQGEAWAACGREVVEWFALRRSAEFTVLDGHPGSMRVSAADPGSLPRLLLRCYNRSPGQASAAEDIPWSGSLELAG